MRRCRLPPSSMGWPTLKVYWVTATLPLPNCSARKVAVGFGRRAAVTSLAPTACTSYSLARMVGLVARARLTASSRVSFVKGGGACAADGLAAPTSARQQVTVSILTIYVPSVERYERVGKRRVRRRRRRKARRGEATDAASAGRGILGAAARAGAPPNGRAARPRGAR